MATLPLFPLPLVLFPGVPLPLHIFEPRYRQLLADCLAGDHRFGIVFRPSNVAEHALPPRHVGCVAEIQTSESLDDGRSNLIVLGAERFALVRLVATDRLYHVAEVESYADELEAEPEVHAAGERVRRLFDRVGRAARTIADDADPVPDLPDDAANVAFAVASMIDLDNPARQALLANRSALARLGEIERVLAGAVGPVESGAAVHDRAKTNGHGHHHDS